VRTVLLGSKEEEITHPPGVAPLVVVPSDELDEIFVELNTCGGIEDGGGGVADEVSGHDSVLGVGEDAFKRTVRGFLDSRLDVP